MKFLLEAFRDTLRPALLSTLGLAAILGSISCEKEPPSAPAPERPALRIYYAPEKISRRSALPAKLMVETLHGEALRNDAAVHLILRQKGTALIEAILQDNGKNGDILAGDYVYTFVFLPSQLPLQTGTLRADAYLKDAEGTLLDTTFTVIDVVDSAAGVPPVISDVALPDSLVILQDQFVTFSVTAADADSDLAQISLKIYTANSLQPVFEKEWPVSGGSATVEDSLNTDQFPEIRTHLFFRFQAEDRSGNRSFPCTVQLHLQRYHKNDPPVILEIIAPDTLSRTQASTFLVEVRVDDPQGLGDIFRVLLNTYLPDGELSSNSPFLLRDDGFGGDKTPGDGIYTQRFQIPSDTPLGTYRFEAIAEDKTGAKSEPKNHYLTVIE